MGLVDNDGREPEKTTKDLDTDLLFEFDFSNYLQRNKNIQQELHEVKEECELGG